MEIRRASSQGAMVGAGFAGGAVPRVKYPAPSATIRNPHVATA